MHRWSNRTQWFHEPCGVIRERPMPHALGCPNANSVDAHQSSFVCYKLRFCICQLDSFCRIVPSASSSTSSVSSSLRCHNPTILDLLPSLAMRVGTLVVRSWTICCTRDKNSASNLSFVNYLEFRNSDLSSFGEEESSTPVQCGARTSTMES